MTRVVDFIIGAGWLAFWVYWMAMAVKTRQQTRPKASQGVVMRLGIVALALIVVAALPPSWAQTHQNEYALVSGLALFVVGLLTAIWARVYLGSSWGLPGDERQKTNLITDGPYRFIRHPIYSGVLLAMIGTAIAVELYWLVVFIAFFGYFAWSAVAEESFLVRKFPNDYPQYMKRTKMLVPFLL